MNANKISEETIRRNYEVKAKLFDKLGPALAHDVWFYVHLANYGQAVYEFDYAGEVNGCPCFTLTCYRLTYNEWDDGFVQQRLFDVEFDKFKSWSEFISEMRAHSKEVLKVC